MRWILAAMAAMLACVLGYPIVWGAVALVTWPLGFHTHFFSLSVLDIGLAFTMSLAVGLGCVYAPVYAIAQRRSPVSRRFSLWLGAASGLMASAGFFWKFNLGEAPADPFAFTGWLALHPFILFGLYPMTVGGLVFGHVASRR